MVNNLIICVVSLISIKLSNSFGYHYDYNSGLFSIAIYFITFTFLFKKSRSAVLAFYLCSIYFVGHLSIIFGYSIRTILAVYYVTILLYFNRKTIINKRKLIFILSALLILFFLIGIYNINFPEQYSRAYLMIGFWASSFLIAFLSVRSIDAYIEFLKYISFFSIFFILSFPLEYIYILKEYFYTSHPIYLSLGNINRSEIAYLTLLGVSYSLYKILILKDNKYFLILIINIFIVIFCGSKVPFFLLIFIILIATFFNKNKIININILILLFIAFLIYFNSSFYNTYLNIYSDTVNHSFYTRISLLEQAIQNENFKQQLSTMNFVYGNGFGSSVINSIVNGHIKYQAGSGIFLFDAFYETGLFGLGIGIFLFFFILAVIFKFPKYCYLLFCVFLAVIFKSIFSSEFYNDVFILVISGISIRLFFENTIKSKFNFNINIHK